MWGRVEEVRNEILKLRRISMSGGIWRGKKRQCTSVGSVGS